MYSVVGMWYTKLVKNFHYAVQICHSRCFRDVFGEMPLHTKTRGTYLPDIEFNTDSREDADKYAEIKKRSDEERDYIVLTLD